MSYWDRFSDADRAWGLRLPVDRLGLSAHAQRTLSRAGVSLAGELVAMTEIDLMKIKGLGRGTLGEIKQRLAEVGLSLTHYAEKEAVRRIVAWLRNRARAELSIISYGAAADAIERGDWRKP